MSSLEKVVGVDGDRRDTLSKVTGRERFSGDYKVPGALALAIARSTEAHALIKNIDSSKAQALPWVVRVFTARDVPGENSYGIIPITKDQPMLAEGKVRFKGEAVALVAAETLEAAREAAALIRVDYEPLKASFTPEEALADGADKIHEKGNLCFEHDSLMGDPDKAFAEAAVVVEDTYTTSSIEHSYMEPESGFAVMEDDIVAVTVSTQNPHYDHADLCRLLGLENDKVRVKQATTGGGFGGKLDLSVHSYVALATLLTGRPSRLTYTREESFAASAKRHSFTMKYRTAADAEGNLLAVDAELIADTGAYASYGVAVAMRAAVHAAGPYMVPNSRVYSRAVYTNHVFSGAMRGFGVPQVALAHESQMEKIAAKLGIDPIELRLKNALKPGDKTITGQVLGDSVGIRECLEKIKAVRDGWGAAADDPDCFRGIGVGAMLYGIGNTGVSNPSTAQIRVNEAGGVTLYTGCADIGQGSDHALLAICAETLGLSREDIALVRADTKLTTNAGATSASRQTYISGNAVKDASEKFMAKAIEETAKITGKDIADLCFTGTGVKGAEREVTLTEIAESLKEQGNELIGEGYFDPETVPLDHHTGQGKPYSTYGFAAQLTRVHVDKATAEVKVEKLFAVHDIGKAIYPQGVIGQISGGSAMGVGLALMEEFDHASDKNFDTYLIPTVLDVPDVEASFIEHAEPTGPYGAKGVGEPALIPTAPAIVNAISDAVGVRITSLPANLERVHRALQLMGGK
ncbi:MAG: aldehyde oxidase [Deltaproteobacteria bacterium]|nr:MAG: aldehyde oxidase [Deltaproteobacteria bacterium]